MLPFTVFIKILFIFFLVISGGDTEHLCLCILGKKKKSLSWNFLCLS